MVELIEQQGAQRAAQILRHQQYAGVVLAGGKGLLEQLNKLGAVLIVQSKEHARLGLAQCLAKDVFAMGRQQPGMQTVSLTVQMIDLRLQGNAHIVCQRCHFAFVLAMLGQHFDNQADRTQRHPFTGQTLQHGRESRDRHDALQLLNQLRLALLEPAEDQLALLQSQKLRPTDHHGLAHALNNQGMGAKRLDTFPGQQRVIGLQP